MKAIATKKYAILRLDEDLDAISNTDEISDVDIDQNKGDKLDVWKFREDGFLFVFCNRLDIGYWVSPNLVEIVND